MKIVGLGDVCALRVQMGPGAARAGMKGEVSRHVKALLVLGAFEFLDLRVMPVQGDPVFSAGLCAGSMY